MQERLTTALLTVALLAALPAAAESGRSLGRSAPEIDADRASVPVAPAAPRIGRPIDNKVVDLLDEAFFLAADGGPEEWLSEPFDTSQFNRLILKAASEVDSGSISCGAEWSLGPDDTFAAGGTTTILIGDDAQLRRFPGGLTPVPVVGLRARIRCHLVAPDFGGGDPPPPPAGSLTDVRVLLRRE